MMEVRREPQQEQWPLADTFSRPTLKARSSDYHHRSEEEINQVFTPIVSNS